MSRRDIQAGRDGYDAAGILDGDEPPPGLVDLVSTADLVVVSDMPRALQTAERLTTRNPLISALVRETPPPIPYWMHVRMPRHFWEWSAIARWTYWIMKGVYGPPDAMQRATQAANWLDDLSIRHSHIAVVTHGTFRRLMTYRLEHIGWRKTPGSSRSYRHWSVWSLEK